MDARKIYVICTSDQSRHELMSSATTLGEFKEDLNNAHIDYTNMSFLEGRSKTELHSDDSPLPTNVPTRDGGTTNELVFMLTNMKKKIQSGSPRTDLYEKIRNTEGLAEAIKEHFNGINYTNIATPALAEFVEEWESEDTEHCAFEDLLDYLEDTDEITPYAKCEILKFFKKNCQGDSFPSDEELHSMFDFVD